MTSEQSVSWLAAVPPAIVALCAAYDRWSASYAESLRNLYGLSRAERNRRAVPPFPAWTAQQGIVLPPEPLAPFTEPLGLAGNTPLLPSLYSATGTTQYIYCCHCDALHGHGVGSGGRAAHCIEESPYSRSGYVVVPTGAMTDAIERAVYAGRRKRQTRSTGSTAR